LSLADFADLADLYDRCMACGEKICVICGICETLYSCEKTISSREIIRSRSVREIALREFFSELFGSNEKIVYLCTY
jgi:hypothetical protein